MSRQTARRINTREAAEYVGLSVSTLEAFRRENKGPSYLNLSKRRVVYDTGDLDSWLASKRHAAAPGA